jgi:hypothetical protein
MKAFLVSVAIAIVIAGLAAVILGNLDLSSADLFQADQGNVRL